MPANSRWDLIRRLRVKPCNFYIRLQSFRLEKEKKSEDSCNSLFLRTPVKRINLANKVHFLYETFIDNPLCCGLAAIFVYNTTIFGKSSLSLQLQVTVNKMQLFLNLFLQMLYMFQAVPPLIFRST